MKRVYNFSAGPACLPEEVLKEAAAGFGAERSHHIGGACVAAAVIADIDAVGLSVNIAGLKETDEITDGQTADSNPHTHLSFSCLSRIMNFREVPWKPKVSRILFSK